MNTKTVKPLTNYNTNDYYSSGFDYDQIHSKSYSHLITNTNNNYKSDQKSRNDWSSKEIGFVVGMAVGGLLLIILIIILILLIVKYKRLSKAKIENLSSSSETTESNDLESHSDFIRPDSKLLSSMSGSNSLLVRPEIELLRPTTAFIVPESTVEILQSSSSLSSLD